jgi:hypothetical protein
MNCRHCEQPLKRIPWNNAGNSLHCETSGCDLFHAPQGWIPRYTDEHHLDFLTQEKMDATQGLSLRYAKGKKDAARLSGTNLSDVQK